MEHDPIPGQRGVSHLRAGRCGVRGGAGRHVLGRVLRSVCRRLVPDIRRMRRRLVRSRAHGVRTQPELLHRRAHRHRCLVRPRPRRHGRRGRQRQLLVQQRHVEGLHRGNPRAALRHPPHQRCALRRGRDLRQGRQRDQHRLRRRLDHQEGGRDDLRRGQRGARGRGRRRAGQAHRHALRRVVPGGHHEPGRLRRGRARQPRIRLRHGPAALPGKPLERGVHVVQLRQPYDRQNRVRPLCDGILRPHEGGLRGHHHARDAHRVEPRPLQGRRRQPGLRLLPRRDRASPLRPRAADRRRRARRRGRLRGGARAPGRDRRRSTVARERRDRAHLRHRCRHRRPLPRAI